MEFSGTSIMCVQRQSTGQSAGLLSPLQNSSGDSSCICESGGAGGELYDISSTKLMTWSPVGATGSETVTRLGDYDFIFSMELSSEPWKTQSGPY